MSKKINKRVDPKPAKADDAAREAAAKLRLPLGVIGEIDALAARSGKTRDAVAKEIASEVSPKAETHTEVWASRVTQGHAVKELRARLAK